LLIAGARLVAGGGSQRQDRASPAWGRHVSSLKCEFGMPAPRPGETVAVEIETGKSNTKENLAKIAHAGFDRIVLVATSPAASVVCQKVLADVRGGPPVQLLTWLDIP
jgi:hypothetical protein